MGRIEIAKKNIVAMNAPYSYNITPNLRVYNSNYAIPLANNILTPYNHYQEAAFWGINYNQQGQYDITPATLAEVDNFEIQCRFKFFKQPSYTEELFCMCGIFTPDIETNNALGFWDAANGRYWLEYPCNLDSWYWLKLYYDKATYTQTWSISTDGTNFAVIGTHTEDRNSELETNWDGVYSENLSYLSFGCLNFNFQTSLQGMRALSCGVIDMTDTYIKVNGVMKCHGSITGSV